MGTTTKNTSSSTAMPPGQRRGRSCSRGRSPTCPWPRPTGPRRRTARRRARGPTRAAAAGATPGRSKTNSSGSVTRRQAPRTIRYWNRSIASPSARSLWKEPRPGERGRHDRGKRRSFASSGLSPWVVPGPCSGRWRFPGSLRRESLARMRDAVIPGRRTFPRLGRIPGARWRRTMGMPDRRTRSTTVELCAQSRTPRMVTVATTMTTGARPTTLSSSWPSAPARTARWRRRTGATVVRSTPSPVAPRATTWPTS